MQTEKRYTQGFSGLQINDPLIKNAGMVVETIPQKHEWNCHDGYELVFLGKGTQLFEKEDQKNVIHIPGGHFSIMHPKVKHRSKYGIFFPSTFYWIVLNPFNKKTLSKSIYTPEQMKALFAEVDSSEKSVARSSALLIQLLEQHSQALRQLSVLDPRASAQANKTELKSSAELQNWLRTLVNMIIIEALRCFKQSSRTKTNKYVVAARQFIVDNFMNEINIHDVIAPLGISEAYLYNVFKEETGLTPNSYLLNMRLQKACDILINTNISITRVSLETGFSCSQYFSNVFKSYVGETPSSFRRRNKIALPPQKYYLG